MARYVSSTVTCTFPAGALPVLAPCAEQGQPATHQDAHAAALKLDGLHHEHAHRGHEQAVPGEEAGEEVAQEEVAQEEVAQEEVAQEERESAPYFDRCAWDESVVDYVAEIISNRKKLEREACVEANYMRTQPLLSVKMRAILVDWLWEVWKKFELRFEAMFLAVQLLDRYLAKRPCERRKLQLVGVTAMLVAAKVEEEYFPEVRDFVYVTDRAYTREQVIEMEGAMTAELEFSLAVPTACTFIDYYTQNVEPGCARTRCAAMFAFGAVSLGVEMAAELPSQVAFGCAVFSLLNRHLLNDAALSYGRRMLAGSGIPSSGGSRPACKLADSSPPAPVPVPPPVVPLAGETLERKLHLLERCAQLERSHPCVAKVFACAAAYVAGTLLAVQKFSGVFPDAATVSKQSRVIGAHGSLGERVAARLWTAAAVSRARAK